MDHEIAQAGGGAGKLKARRAAAAAAVLVALLAGAAPGGQATGGSSGPALARGRALFEGKTLGTNGRRCADCHAAGKGLDDVSEQADAALAAYVNSCIQGMLAGKPLAAGSDDLRSLVLYVRSLAPAAK